MIIIPIQECSEGDKKGFKWGNAGKCYLHDGSDKSIGQAKENAYLQGVAEGGGKLETNAQELTREYLLEFYNLVLSHPGIMKQITDEIHITARAKAGGQLHGQKETGQTMPEMKVNASQFGGHVIEATDEITVIPAVLMAEGVRNGGLHRYEDFSQDVRWFEGVPIVPPHSAANPAASLVNQKTVKLGQIRNVKLNADKRRVEAEAVLFNNKFDPNDLARIKTGEAFGGSIGFYADDEPLSEPLKWSDGKPYNRIEKNFFGNHFSIVGDPACPLGTCGFNVNSIEVIEMTEEVPKVETPKVNTEVKPVVTPPVVAETPKVNVEVPKDLSALIGKIDSLVGDVATIKVNMAAKDEEIKTLKADLEVRTNAQKASDDALITATLSDMVLPAFKDKVAEYFPAFKANAALWIAQNRDKLDLVTYSATKITPTGQPFVPHVNASDEDEYANLGVMSVEALGKAVKGSA